MGYISTSDVTHQGECLLLHFTVPRCHDMDFHWSCCLWKVETTQSVPPRQGNKLTASVLTVCMAVPGAVLPRWGEWTPAKFAPLWWVQGEQEAEFHSTHFHLCFQNKISTKFDHKELFYWRVSAMSCVQALKAYLTHNSMNSRQLMEKFFERKIWEQVREKPCRMYSSEQKFLDTLPIIAN